MKDITTLLFKYILKASEAFDYFLNRGKMGSKIGTWMVVRGKEGGGVVSK